MNDNIAQRAMFLAGEMMGDIAKCGLTPKRYVIGCSLFQAIVKEFGKYYDSKVSLDTLTLCGVPVEIIYVPSERWTLKLETCELAKDFGEVE